ncbi:hypothetical protein [Nocardia asiatica]|uniref:hypothetical protein n=1 Tax=Nocardia asiatica TaxID=209252 RepID=UPI0002EC6571|nr:hypothetical protein [Nocardia asiatica]
MAEEVIRHRGGGTDPDGNPIPWTDATLTAWAVAPGATEEYKDRGRDGQRVDMSVYFMPAVDLGSEDELTVRGDRYFVQVEQWISPFSAWTGTVALCSRGEG